MKENPDSPDLQRVEATIWGLLVSLYLLDGQAERALDYGGRALAQARTALAADPKNSVARRDLVVGLHDFGLAQAAAKQLDASAATQQEAIALQRGWCAEDPTNAQCRRDLCQLMNSAAQADLDRAEWKGAEAGFRQLRDATLALLKLDPDHLLAHEAHLEGLAGLGEALAGRKAHAEALVANREAISGVDALIAKNPDQLRLANRRAIWLSHQGRMLVAQRACPAAKAVLLQAQSAFDALATTDALLPQTKDAQDAVKDGLAQCAK